jgi:hypothetical protein
MSGAPSGKPPPPAILAHDPAGAKKGLASRFHGTTFARLSLLASFRLPGCGLAETT